MELEGYKITYNYVDSVEEKVIHTTLIFVGSFYEAISFVRDNIGTCVVHDLKIETTPIFSV